MSKNNVELSSYERADALSDITAYYLGKLVGDTFGSTSGRVRADAFDVVRTMQAGEISDTDAVFKLADIETERVIFGRS